MKFRRGSTMVVVICTIGILWMVGLALSSLAVTNLKVKKIEDSRKKAFYSAEAGLDQAYAVALEHVEDAIRDGNDNVKTKTAELIAREREQFVIGEESDCFYSDGTLKFAEVEKHFQGWFKEGFEHYFDLKSLPDIIKDYEYKAVSGYTMPPEITVDEGESYGFGESPYAAKQEEMCVSMISRFHLEKEEGNITRRLHANINIKVPVYDSSYSCVNNKVDAKVHPLFEKAVTSDGDTVLEGSVQVRGDIYAYGAEGGGLIVGDGSAGTLEIEGNIISHNDVAVKKDNSSVKLSGGGYVYCSSLEIPSGVSGCDIEINGNVNTCDDIVFNGARSRLFVDGTYYGFSDGRTGSLVDAGSSIVINSPDIGNASSLEITGKRNLNAEMNETTPENGVYIAGTVYIDGEKKYQTGESVAIKGNYLAYTKPLSGLTGDNAIYNSNNVIRRYYDSMELADEFITRDAGSAAASVYTGESTAEIAENKLTQQEKSRYLTLYGELNPTGINKGKGKVNIFGVLHSLGNYVSENRLNDSKIGNIGKNYEVMKTNLYNFHTNWLNPAYASIATENSITALAARGATVENSVPNYSVNLIPASYAKDVYKTAVINSDPSRAVLIRGRDGEVPGELEGRSYIEVKPDTEAVHGAVFSKGDVYVTGKIDYMGTIASAKNVCIKDNHPKSFTASKYVVLKNLFDLEIENSKPKLAYVNAFKYPGFSGMGGGLLINAVDTLSLVYNSTASVGDITNYDAASQAIQLSDFYRVIN